MRDRFIKARDEVDRLRAELDALDRASRQPQRTITPQAACTVHWQAWRGSVSRTVTIEAAGGGRETFAQEWPAPQGRRLRDGDCGGGTGGQPWVTRDELASQAIASLDAALIDRVKARVEAVYEAAVSARIQKAAAGADPEAAREEAAWLRWLFRRTPEEGDAKYVPAGFLSAR
jgi:hypothetical protein